MNLFWLRLLRGSQLFLILSVFGSLGASAQNFSFNCARDTIVPGCPPNLCITLTSKIPDIKGQSSTYSINPASTPNGCFPVYSDPSIQGTWTSLTTDDIYSSAISIGFPFQFYGNTYSDLKVSSNGYLTFNTSLSGFSHYGILRSGTALSATSGTPEDLPSTLYAQAIIMGAYHDIDISVTSSPTRRIQYTTVGTAPHRRWILSFYKIPLYQTSCNSLIENTHQIILYESTGIIEVTMFSKQICNTWNEGRAMIGIQNFARDQAVMAPGRKASDAPWGSVNMNETWRFVPDAGASLLKRVELLDGTGAFIMNGTTAPAGSGLLEVSFPNVCAPAGATTTYIVRSVYQKIDDPSAEIFGIDTVRVNRSQALSSTTSTTAASCGSTNGSISVTATTGGTPPYEYSLDGTNWQSSTVFANLAAGNYTVYIRDNGGTCTLNLPVTIGNAGALAATASTNATACAGVNNGSITVNTAGGTGPWNFSLNGGPPQTGTVPYTFSNLPAGNYTLVVTDQPTGCASNVLNLIVTAGQGVTATTNSSATSCPTATNGSINVTATSGTAPFTFQLDSEPPQTTSSNTIGFTSVSAGSHTVTITDVNGCTVSVNVTVLAGPQLTATVTPTATSCNGAADGSVAIFPNSSSTTFWISLDGGAPVIGNPPLVLTNISAGNHTIVVFDASCTTDPIPFVVTAGPNLTTTSSKTDVSCNGANNGSITVTQPAAGTAPFEYSIDGTNWQSSTTFTGLAAGTYTVYYRSANGCQGSHTVTITEPAILDGTASSIAVVCNGENNGTITVNPSGGTAPYEFSINGGLNWQSAPTFSVPAGTYTVSIRDANGCTVTRPVTVTEPAILTAVANTDPASCDGGSDGSITVSANGGNPAYQYSLDGNTFQASNVFNVTPGSYTVTVRDNFGCVTTLNATVPLGNNFTMTPQADRTICEGTSVSLNLVSNATVYSWSPATGLSDPAIANPVANPTTTTQYIVTATLGNCSEQDTVIVNVNAAPIPNAGPDGFICYGQSYQLQGSGGLQYTWSPATYLDDASIADPISNPTMNVTYTLLDVVDANGCHSLGTDEVTIDVTPPIRVKTLPYDSVAYPGTQFQLNALTNDPDVVNYVWSPALGLSSTTVANPTVTVGAIGDDVVYQVTASTNSGCKGEGYVRVRVYKGPDLYVPTGFTPNGDGKNEKFTPFPVGVKELKFFRVFNRWGQMIFSTNRLHEGWDGKLNGREQPTGVYVWTAEAVTDDNRVISKKGTVTLIR